MTMKMTPRPTAPRSLRESTAQKTSASSALRRKLVEEAKAQAQGKSKKAVVGRARMTQEELLAEAVQTELENTQSLTRMERMEEERKAEQGVAPKAPFVGAVVRYHSRIGMPKTITFLNTEQWPSIFNQTRPTKRMRREKEKEREDESKQEQEREEEDAEEEDTSIDAATKHVPTTQVDRATSAVEAVASAT